MADIDMEAIRERLAEYRANQRRNDFYCKHTALYENFVQALADVRALLSALAGAPGRAAPEPTEPCPDCGAMIPANENCGRCAFEEGTDA